MDLKVVQLEEKMFEDLKKVNTLVFGKPFPEQHYRHLIKFGLPLSFMIYDKEKPIGEICTRIEDDKCGVTVHSVSMGVIPDYRRKGISKYLIQATQKVILKYRPRITKVFLMVEETNEVAFNIYKKLGFKVEGKIRTRIVMGKLVAEVLKELDEKKKLGELKKEEKKC